MKPFDHVRRCGYIGNNQQGDRHGVATGLPFSRRSMRQRACARA